MEISKISSKSNEFNEKVSSKNLAIALKRLRKNDKLTRTQVNQASESAKKKAFLRDLSERS